MSGEHTFGDLLKQFRVRERMNQTELAEALHVHRNTISNWECGKDLPRTRSIVQDLADELHLNQEDTDKLLKANFQGFSWEPFLNIPHQRNLFFTGREEVLTHLHTLLHTSKTVALTQIQAISGLGGIGKTQTAIEYAYRHCDDYSAVLWVKADTSEVLTADFAALASVLHLPEQNDQDQHRALEAVKRWLKTHSNWLLILDNVEDVTHIGHVLSFDNPGHILLTTRASATGTVAQRLDLDQMEPGEGALFLLRRAKLITPDAPLEEACEADQDGAKAISQLLDGLPLALDQAGAYIEETACGLSGYVERYQKQRATLLNRRGRLTADHPKSVSTTLSLSFEKVEHMNPAAADLLRLSAFLDPDAIPEELLTEGASELGPALQPIVTDPLTFDEALAVLRTYSLVRRNPQAKTLTIHRLVQAVIQDNMDKETQRTWAERAIRTVHHAFPDKVNDVKTWDKCKSCLPHALACANLINDYGLAFPEAAQLLNQTGYYLREQASYPEAEKFLLQTLAISKKLGPEHLLYTAQILNNLARLYFDQYMYVKAEPFYERALAIREQKLGPEDPVIIQNLNSLALNYWYEGKYEKAEPLYQRALPISEQKLGPEHAQTLYILNNIALLYRSQDKYEEAIKLNQHVLETRERKFGSVHLDVAQSLQNLAVTYYEQGNQSKYEEAEDLLNQALAIREELLPKKHLQIARCRRYLALVYEVQDKDEKAEECFKRALDILEEKLGVDHSQTIETKEQYAALLRKMKRDEEAAILEAQIKAIQASKSSED